MQNSRIGKRSPAPLPGIKHKGTITLNDGTTFSPDQIKKDPAKVMTAIIAQQRAMYQKTIDMWIHARAAAENPIYPMRTLLYDIYEDVMIDGFLTGIIYNHRILPVKNKAFKIKNAADKPEEEKTKWFARQWFRDLITYGLESMVWGYSLPYFDEVSFDGTTTWIKTIDLVPRKHVHQEKGVITVFQTDLEGMDYTKPPISNYVIPIGNKKDLGLLNKATPLVLLKKHGWNNWDEFAERFGMPIITVKTASQDPRVQSEIEDWLDELSTGAYGIFPADTEIDIKENKKTDAYMVFSEMISKVDEELAILFLGQTMTTKNGSSRSQGEVHERVKDEITKDDEIFMATIINEYLIPLLRDVHKWPFVDGDYFQWDQPEDKQELLKIFTGVTQMGFQIDPKQVEEKFGTKIIGLKQVAQAAPGKDGKPQPDEQEQEEQPEPDKPGKPTKGGGKAEPDPDDASELKASDLIKLHAKMHEWYGGNHVR